jgi:hypothetical protein
MPEQIKDGKGRGYHAEVTAENRLKVSSVSRSKEHDANLTYGDSYNMIVDITTGANGCFLYVKNTGTRNIVFEGFGVYVSSAEKIWGKLGDTGTPVDGTDVVPVNLNAGSNSEATGTFQTGSSITGLSGGATFETFRVPANTATNIVNFEADIVLPPNQVFTAYALTGSVTLEGHLNFWIDREGA